MRMHTYLGTATDPLPSFRFTFVSAANWFGHKFSTFRVRIADSELFLRGFWLTKIYSSVETECEEPTAEPLEGYSFRLLPLSYYDVDQDFVHFSMISPVSFEALVILNIHRPPTKCSYSRMSRTNI